ncbi:MAG TPA: type II toxin-antitoxin system HigB family toxin [Candidatus Tumulicola sp.]|nr:type II toxin-antitoxin system HigB family toxin [Candidatus Tumulicola sp.]
MLVVGAAVLEEYAITYPDAKRQLKTWLTVAEGAAWSNIIELRKTYPQADYVKPYTVLNIKGNNYRLITIIDYQRQLINIEQFLTHSSYNKGKWKR